MKLYLTLPCSIRIAALPNPSRMALIFNYERTGQYYYYSSLSGSNICSNPTGSRRSNSSRGDSKPSIQYNSYERFRLGISPVSVR